MKSEHTNLAAAILRAAGDVQGPGVFAHCLGVRKVFVAAIYDQIGAAEQGWTRGEFAALLARLQLAGLIEMSRLDLVPSLTPAQRALNARSRVERGCAEWHLVRLAA